MPPSQFPSYVKRLSRAKPVSQPCAILSQLPPSKLPIKTEEKPPFHQTKNHNPTGRKTNQRLTNASKNTTRQLLHAKCVRWASAVSHPARQLLHANFIYCLSSSWHFLHVKIIRCSVLSRCLQYVSPTGFF